MKSFFIRRERAKKCSKKRCMDHVAWTWTLLEQNRSDRGVNMRPAHMQQRASKKEIPVGEKNRTKEIRT